MLCIKILISLNGAGLQVNRLYGSFVVLVD